MTLNTNLTDTAYTSRLRVARCLNWTATPLNRLSLWAAQVVVQDRVMRSEFNHPRSHVRAARATLLSVKPFNRPTLWAAQVIISDRLHRQGMGTRASARTSRFMTFPAAR